MPTVTFTLITQWPMSEPLSYETTIKFCIPTFNPYLRVDIHGYQQNDVVHSHNLIS